MKTLHLRFEAFLKAHKPKDWPALPGRTNHKKAGILVPIIKDKPWTCLLTLRTSTLRAHGGEICFPGGKPDPQDIDLKHTALRECYEEIGLSNVEVIGSLSSVPLYTSDYRLVPFVALIEPNSSFSICKEEVEQLITISLRQVFHLPYLDAVPFSYQEKTYLSPVFFPSKLGCPHPVHRAIFGGTAHVLYELLELLSKCLNRQLPPKRATLSEFPFPKGMGSSTR